MECDERKTEEKMIDDIEKELLSSLPSSYFISNEKCVIKEQVYLAKESRVLKQKPLSPLSETDFCISFGVATLLRCCNIQ